MNCVAWVFIVLDEFNLYTKLDIQCQKSLARKTTTTKQKENREWIYRLYLFVGNILQIFKIKVFHSFVVYFFISDWMKSNRSIKILYWNWYDLTFPKIYSDIKIRATIVSNHKSAKSSYKNEEGKFVDFRMTNDERETMNDRWKVHNIICHICQIAAAKDLD